MSKLDFQMPARARSTRDVIASFPSYVAADADGLYCRSRFIIITPGEPGYHPTGATTLEEADAIAMKWGATRPANEAEREAAQTGSMFGWHAPGADPANWHPKADDVPQLEQTGRDANDRPTYARTN